MIQQMNFLGLVVKDLNSATAFYRDTLGLTVNEKESQPGFYTQFNTNGGAILGLVTGFEQQGVNQSFDTALQVSDVDGVYAAWKAAGVEMVNEPRDMPFGRTFLFRTPDGHILRVYSRPLAGQ
jgi:predicted enzyme related to lactoylglutathione lyase